VSLNIRLSLMTITSAEAAHKRRSRKEQKPYNETNNKH
jgi:hypothetical protein